MKLRVFLGRQFAAGEDNDRNVGKPAVGAHALQHFEARHVRQAQIEHHAIAGALLQRAQRLAARCGIDDLDVVMTEQFADAHLLDPVVLDDQQALAARLGKLLDARQRLVDALARRRLVDEGEGAARETVLAVFVERDDLHRNVPGQRILLELAEHVPAQHVGQEHVERNRGRLILFGEIERIVAAHRQQRLEALVARQIDQDAGIVRIVLDDEQDGVAGLDIHPIVGDRLDRALGRDMQPGQLGRGRRYRGRRWRASPRSDRHI